MIDKIILLLIVLAAAGVAPAQDAKELTRAEFIKAVRETADKFSKTPARRETQKLEYFRDGKPAGTTLSVYEWAAPDRFRDVTVRTDDKSVVKTETIVVGKDHYCRTNDGPWKKAPSCGGGGGMGLENVVGSRYSVEKVRENGKKLKVYREYTLYKGHLTKDASDAPVLYWEEKIFVDENGAELREEIESGVEATKEVRFRMKTVYEYDPPGLRIEPPIE